MKKIGFIKLLGIILITFGITYLDIDNLQFDANYKAYSSIIIGLITLIISFLKPQKVNDKS